MNITEFVLAKLIRFQNKKRMSGAKKYPTKTEIKGGLCLVQQDTYSGACEEDIGAKIFIKCRLQITALFILVFWISRTISELKGRNETQDERLRQMDKNIEQLFVLWNEHIDRLLDEARRGKN